MIEESIERQERMYKDCLERALEWINFAEKYTGSEYERSCLWELQQTIEEVLDNNE